MKYVSLQKTSSPCPTDFNYQIKKINYSSDLRIEETRTPLEVSGCMYLQLICKKNDVNSSKSSTSNFVIFFPKNKIKVLTHQNLNFSFPLTMVKCEWKTSIWLKTPSYYSHQKHNEKWRWCVFAAHLLEELWQPIKIQHFKFLYHYHQWRLFHHHFQMQ